MRSLVVSLCLCLVVVTACTTSSTGRSGTWETFFDDKEMVMQAAMMAMNAIGARILSNNPDSGTILGRLHSDSTGALVNVDVSVRAYLDGAEVRVKAIGQASSPDQPAQVDEAESIEQQFMDELKAILAEMGHQRRGRRR